MNNKKRYRSAVAVLLVLSLVWIIAICAMMWGRSVAAFSFIKLTIFIALIVVEVVTVTAEFICAAKLGRLNNEQDAEEKALPEAEDRLSGERRHQRRVDETTGAVAGQLGAVNRRRYHEGILSPATPEQKRRHHFPAGKTIPSVYPIKTTLDCAVRKLQLPSVGFCRRNNRITRRAGSQEDFSVFPAPSPPDGAVSPDAVRW